MASELAKLFVTLGLDDKEFQSRIKGVETNMKNVGMMMTGIGAGITAGMGLATKAAADFDSAMREVNTMMQLGEGDFKTFSKEVQDLSAELGVDAVDSAKALYQAISAGVPKENAIEFLRVATKAAIGGVTDTETAVDGLTTVLNAFKIPVSDAQRVADLMFTTVKGGKTTMAELSASLFNVAPVASTAGVKFEEVSAAIATMTKQGIPTTQATTQLRQAIVAMIKPTADMKTALTELGYESGEALISEKGLAGALQLLTEHTGGSNEMLGTMLGSVEGLNAVLALSGDNAVTFAGDLDTMANSTGAAENAFTQMEQSTSRQMETLKNSFQDIAISVGQTLLPMLNKIVEFIKPIIENIKNWMEQNPGLSQTIIIVTAAVGGLFAILGPLLMMLPTLAAGFNLLLGPVGLVIAAIAALVAITVVIVKNWDKIVEFFKGVWDAIVGFFKKAWEWIKEYGLYFLGLPGIIIKHWDTIADFFKKVWEGIKNAFKSAINFLIGLAEGFVNFFIKGINFIIGALNKIHFDIPDWVPLLGGKKFGINIGLIPEIKLPRLKEGAIALEPTLAMVGDNPAGEAIIPLDRLQGLGSQQINVYVSGSVIAEQELLNIIQRTATSFKRANGLTGLA